MIAGLTGTGGLGAFSKYTFVVTFLVSLLHGIELEVIAQGGQNGVGSSKVPMPDKILHCGHTTSPTLFKYQILVPIYDPVLVAIHTANVRRCSAVRHSDVVKSDVILSLAGGVYRKNSALLRGRTFLTSRTKSALQRRADFYLPQLRVQFVGSEVRELPLETPVLQKGRGREMSSAERIHAGC